MNQIVYAGKHLLTYSVARHSHSAWEFIYCTSGAGRLVFDEGPLSYAAGDIALIPPGVPHANVSEDGFTNIHVNMAGPSLTVKKPALLRDDGSLLTLNAFSGAFFQFSADGGRQTPLLSAYGQLIVCHLLALQESPACARVAEEIANAIVNNYPDCDFALDVYLRALPFSYDYVRRLFKKEMGVTPHRYLSDMRLQTAAQYLGSSAPDGRSVTEVARLCGFREPLYFSRMFKKKYGVSPSAYSQL